MTRKQTPYMFFKTHAGFSWDSAKGETQEQGKQRSAKALAEAEARAEELGLLFFWEYEESPDVSWMDEEQLEDYKQGAIEMLCCTCKTQTGKYLSSCGNIGLDVNDRYQYKRVMQAELALEAIGELERIAEVV